MFYGIDIPVPFRGDTGGLADRLGPRSAAYDSMYAIEPTPFRQRAAEGIEGPGVGGLGMLVEVDETMTKASVGLGHRFAYRYGLGRIRSPTPPPDASGETIRPGGFAGSTDDQGGQA